MNETLENLKQANFAIRERDFVITNQREAGKSLFQDLLCQKICLEKASIVIVSTKLMTCYISEKSLVNRAAELRKELEAAAQDVAGLFAKIGTVYCALFVITDT